MQTLLRALRLLPQLLRLLLKMRSFSDRVALAAGVPLATAVGLAAPSDNGARWWSYVEHLASDQMQGRQTGSPEHRKAAEYVAAQFERDGLKAAASRATFSRSNSKPSSSMSRTRASR
jgi:hypothetical protein